MIEKSFRFPREPEDFYSFLKKVANKKMEAEIVKNGEKPAEKQTATQHLVLSRILEQVVMIGEQLHGLNLRVGDLEDLLPTIRLGQRDRTTGTRSVQEEIPEPIKD